MFVGHLPASYILTTAGQRAAGDNSKALLATGLVASVVPDADLAWFFFVDHRQVEHHAYLTHTPAFWIGIAALALAVCWMMKWRVGPYFVGIALANLLLHLALDSIAAGVQWFWPLSDFEVNLVRVPARYDWWVWNFVLHWTFALELAVIAAAFGLWIWKRKRPEATAPGL